MSIVSLLTVMPAMLAFLLLLFFLSQFLPGPRRQGVKRENEEQYVYVLNGLLIFLLVLGFTGITVYFDLPMLIWINMHFWEVFICANVIALVLAGILFMSGIRKNKQQALNIQHKMKGFVVGMELNPRWGQVDLKLFSYRPSLIGLVLINMSFAAVQFQKYGYLSDAMLLYQVFTLVYVLNYFQFEYGMLFTWDIIAERFGLMLIWGDYVLVPFFYSLPAWFLVDRVQSFSFGYTTTLVLLFVFGFWLFRGANEQKHRFKSNPETRIWGRPAQTIDGHLLISGFWGIGRHLNYTGEICIYFAFTLTTGFDSVIPYLLPIWLSCLLIHRAWRDESRCRLKYGASWERYTQAARFRIVPFIY